MNEPLRFVLCPSYHGATILAFLVNNHPQLSCLGDTLPWNGRNQSCSCGARVADCAFWRELHRRSGAGRFADQPQMLPLTPRLFAHPGINLAAARALIAASLLLGPGVQRLAPRAAAEFTDAYQRLYAAIRELHGTTHVVDGSKSISKVLALTGLGATGTRSQVLHLVRDPRGYASSLLSRGERAQSPFEIGQGWRQVHTRIQGLCMRLRQFDYLQLRYEDLCLMPEPNLERVFRFFGVAPAEVCHPGMNPDKNHIIGNRMLRHFNGELRLDTRWQTDLSPAHQEQVLRGAGRLAAAYGYR